ncbi:MAG: hypothetical protein CMO44_12670 [Verrucomicrobiales bacterium]|nr:hypothetical protein [Verrucomicrobiales bacterium]|tara:strand:- start:3101 stop:3742 length:642 start_codon:yes stop_codon:yes gene_type:complete
MPYGSGLGGLTQQQIDTLASQGYDVSNMGGGAGAGGDYVASLPAVEDPAAAYAKITRGEYNDFMTNYSQFEEDLLNRAMTDTSLIDQAREDSSMAGDISKGVAARNASRYGNSLTPAQQRALTRSIDRGTALGSVQSLSNARIAQNEANTALMSDLINIGQGLNRTSQNQLGNAAQDQKAREMAYDNARSAHKANTYSTLGSLGAMAIFAMAF